MADLMTDAETDAIRRRAEAADWSRLTDDVEDLLAERDALRQLAGELAKALGDVHAAWAKWDNHAIGIDECSLACQQAIDATAPTLARVRAAGLV